jgi:iron(III) transport system substrate-binding protein
MNPLMVIRIDIAIAVILIFAFAASAQTKKPVSFAELAAYTGADREQLLLAGAKSEAKVVWYTSLGGGSYKAIVQAFETKYPGVKVEVYRAGGSELVTRIMEETKARHNIVDALESTGETLMALRDLRMLAPFVSPYLRNYPEQARERAGKDLFYWITARESYVGFGYNKSKLPASAVAKNFDALLNPELKGRLALGTGGSGAEIVGAILRVKGEAFVRKLKAQEIRLFSLAAPAIRDLVASGEIDAAPSIFQTHALEAAEKGAPVAWEPLDIVPTHAGAAVVAAKAAHPHGALLFADFLLSPDGQALFEKFKYGSAAKDYGFKRWYPETGFTVEQYEREVTKWEKIMHSIVRKGG